MEYTKAERKEHFEELIIDQAKKAISGREVIDFMKNRKTLFECYKNPSNAKQKIWTEWVEEFQDWARITENTVEYGIISHNPFSFSIGAVMHIRHSCYFAKVTHHNFYVYKVKLKG